MSYSFAGFGAFGVGLVVFFGSARPAGGDLLVDLRFDADGPGAVVLPSFIAETAVFIWATDAAAARWPASEEAEAELRAAMRATVPRKIKQRASKANRAAQKAKRAKKGAR